MNLSDGACSFRNGLSSSKKVNKLSLSGIRSSIDWISNISSDGLPSSLSSDSSRWEIVDSFLEQICKNVLIQSNSFLHDGCDSDWEMALDKSVRISSILSLEGSIDRDFNSIGDLLGFVDDKDEGSAGSEGSDDLVSSSCCDFVCGSDGGRSDVSFDSESFDTVSLRICEWSKWINFSMIWFSSSCSLLTEWDCFVDGEDFDAVCNVVLWCYS